MSTSHSNPGWLCSKLLCSSSGLGQVSRNETVLNPNLAAVDQLLALAQLDSELVQGMKARRPFTGHGGIRRLPGFGPC